MQGQVINDQNKLGLLNAMAQGGSAAAAAYNSAQSATQDYKAQAIDKAIGASTAPYAMPGGAGGELASLVGKYTAGAEENTGIAARNAGGIGSGYESAVKSYLDKQRSQLDSDLAYQSAMLNEQRVRADAQARAANATSEKTQAAIRGDAEAMQQQAIAQGQAGEQAQQDKWDAFKQWANQAIDNAPKSAPGGKPKEAPPERPSGPQAILFAPNGVGDLRRAQLADEFRAKAAVARATPGSQADAEQAAKDFAAFQRFVAVSKYGMDPSTAAGLYSSNPLYNKEQAARLEAMAPPDPIEQAKRQKEADALSDYQANREYAASADMLPDDFNALRRSVSKTTATTGKELASMLTSEQYKDMTAQAQKTMSSNDGTTFDEWWQAYAANRPWYTSPDTTDRERAQYRALAQQTLKPLFAGPGGG